MVRVKICGLTRHEDVELAWRSGADALGFIAVSESPRYVSAARVAQLVAEVPPFVTTVAVAKTHNDAAPYPVRVAQIYAPPEANMPLSAVRVFRIGDSRDLEAALAHCGPILLDSRTRGALGGTGVAFDWGLAEEAVDRHPFPVILAGGLTPENVADAVRRVRPYAVDVSSGIESSPGVKDSYRLQRFVDSVRGAF